MSVSKVPRLTPHTLTFRIQVVFDTGSVDIIVTSTLCTSTCTKQHKFNPNASSTFVDSGEDPLYNSFGTCVGVTPVVDDDCYQIISEGSDTVTLAGLTVPESDLFLVLNQTVLWQDDPFDGIFGKLCLHRAACRKG